MKKQCKLTTEEFSEETPWGKAQLAEKIAPGITRYSTASHGGYFLDAEANALIANEWKKATFMEQGLRGWYEEDCDWAIVVYTFSQHFDDDHYQTAVKILKKHYPAIWKNRLTIRFPHDC